MYVRFKSYSMGQSCAVFLCALVILLSGCVPDKNSVGTTDTEKNSAVPTPTPTPQAPVFNSNKAPPCSAPNVTELVVSALIEGRITEAQSVVPYVVDREMKRVEFEPVPEGVEFGRTVTNEEPHWMALGGKCDLDSEIASNPNTDQERLSVDGEATIAECEEQRQLFAQWRVRKEEREASIKAKKKELEALLLPVMMPHGTVRSIRTLSSADDIKMSMCAAFYDSRSGALDGVRTLMNQEEDEGIARANTQILEDLSGLVKNHNYTLSITYTAQVTDVGDEVVVEVLSKEEVANR